ATALEVELPENRIVPMGLNVFRCEVKPSGETTEWSPLYQYDPVGEKLAVTKAIDELFRESLIDEENLSAWTPYLRHGLATPLPQLANLKLPKLKLEGIALGDGDDPEPVTPKPGPMGESGKPKFTLPGMVRPQGNTGVDPGSEIINFVPVGWNKVGKEL